MTGLFFGSFNPIHNGHLDIAGYILDKGLCDEIYFVVSPRNPLKLDDSLLDENKRLEIVSAAIAHDRRMKACDIEFSMPKPSYTIDTLNKLSSFYPQSEFALIIGGDNLRDFHLWKDYREIAARYKIIVYPRPGVETHSPDFPDIEFVNAPLSGISSTEIRKKIQNGEDIANFVPGCVLNPIFRYYKEMLR